LLAPAGRKQLTEKSKSRAHADAAFLKTQTQSMSRNRIMSETDTVTQVRDANTARLKELRLNKEALDRATAEAAPPKPKARKSAKSS
jgi:hypothetical protein